MRAVARNRLGRSTPRIDSEGPPMQKRGKRTSSAERARGVGGTYARNGRSGAWDGLAGIRSGSNEAGAVEWHVRRLSAPTPTPHSLMLRATGRFVQCSAR